MRPWRFHVKMELCNEYEILIKKFTVESGLQGQIKKENHLCAISILIF